MIKICIDPGHYGKFNRSPVVPEYWESDMTWKLYLLQKKYLEQYKNVEVICTKPDQATDVGLVERGLKSKGCNLFISDHSNACGTESVDYVAMYHLVDDTTTDIDNISKAIAEKLGPVIAKTMGTYQGYKILNRKAVSDRNHDGLSNDNYYGVLHGSRMAGTPGIIIEHSFHTNTRMTKWLLDDNNLDMLARMEVETIADIFNLKKLDGSEDPKPAKPMIDPNEPKKLYRVQVGAFSKKNIAKSYLKDLNREGFSGIIAFSDGYYKVQLGAFSVLNNAKKLVDKLHAAGEHGFIV